MKQAEDDLRNITGSPNESSEKNYSTSVKIASYMTEHCIAHVIAFPQHSSRAAPMLSCNRPPRHPSAI
ncbi:hypothetical protein EVAR_28968_1 [Eumeta japonica]|uniref:Uncharacterized protein n=1 Tax=Eumeta variegata TaxID=151549 RepID=A0A4C1VZQ8_EUMVA|nr:hypothetical protein EVAR_28968_1 [Eumeta japonica]